MSRKALKRINAKEKKYVLGDVLGEGAFGQVREGIRVDEGDKFGQRVAVKIISRRLLKKVRNGNENLKKEIRCIKLVKHTNVIKLFDTVDEEDSDKVYLIFELANLLSLQDLCELVREKGIKDPITEVENKWLPIPYIRILFEQLVQGLLACHSKGVVHRDIKPSNLQLTSDGKLKIIDFGVAETLDRYEEVETTEKFAGTPSFQPPEVANGQRSFSATKVDIWAAGVTLYYMVEFNPPFQGSTLAELYINIGKGEFSMPGRADEQLQEVLKGLLNVDPDARWTLEDMLDHTFCDTSAIKVDLTAVLANLNKMDQKSLMKRYMEEEGADSDDEDSSASTADEDQNELDVVRLQDPGADKDVIQKSNAEYSEKKRRKMAAVAECVIS